MKLRERISTAITTCEQGDPYDLIKLIEPFLARGCELQRIIDLGYTEFQVSPMNAFQMLVNVEIIDPSILV